MHAYCKTFRKPGEYKRKNKNHLDWHHRVAWGLSHNLHQHPQSLQMHTEFKEKLRLLCKGNWQFQNKVPSLPFNDILEPPQYHQLEGLFFTKQSIDFYHFCAYVL